MAIPWNKIRAEWLKGGITQKELAAKYGVKLKTIQNRASNEGWKNQKGKIREETEDRLRERVVRARVNHLEKLIEANEMLLDGLVSMAQNIQKRPTHWLTDVQGTMRNAESFAKALKTATETQRDLYRIPNIDQKLAAKKWKEQLKLEKEKAKGPDGDTGPLMVVVHEPAEEPAEEEGADNE
jgi:hypothetical protein